MDSRWEVYRQGLQGHPTIPHTEYKKEDLEYVLEFLPKGSFVLDIGCADGKETLALQELGYNVIGLTNDGAGNVINYINKTIPTIKVYNMDMNCLLFKSEYFDCVYMKHTFEHSFSPFIFMLELNRVLKEGGLILTEHPIYVKDSPMEIYRIYYHHPNLLTKERHEDLFKSTGFKIEKVDYMDGNCHRYLLRKDSSILHSDVSSALKVVKDYTYNRNLNLYA